MDVKLVLALFICACLSLADCCNRNSVNACQDDANCHIKTSNHHDRRKRSFQMNGTQYTLTLNGDPCNFDTYDYNGDGEITGDELLAIFGINEETATLLAHLATMADDEDLAIQPDEFYSMVPQIIPECSNSDN